MGRSSIAGRPIQARVDELLDQGSTLAEIRTLTGAHPSSVHRYANSRKSHLARVVDDEPNVLDIVSRLVANAEDARQARIAASVSGNHTARSRALKLEAEVLTKLMTALGVDDLAQAKVNSQIDELIIVLRTFAQDYPAEARPLVSALKKNNQTAELGEALATQLGVNA